MLKSALFYLCCIVLMVFAGSVFGDKEVVKLSDAKSAPEPLAEMLAKAVQDCNSNPSNCPTAIASIVKSGHSLGSIHTRNFYAQWHINEEGIVQIKNGKLLLTLIAGIAAKDLQSSYDRNECIKQIKALQELQIYVLKDKPTGAINVHISNMCSALILCLDIPI